MITLHDLGKRLGFHAKPETFWDTLTRINAALDRADYAGHSALSLRLGKFHVELTVAKEQK